MQINKSITSIDVRKNSIGAVGQSALFAAATIRLADARRNRSPSRFSLEMDSASTDFRTTKLRTSYFKMAKKPLREKSCCTLARDLFCFSKKEDIGGNDADAAEERTVTGDLVYGAVVLVLAPLIGTWLWLTLIASVIFLMWQRKSMFSLFDLVQRASYEDICDVLKRLLWWKRELNSGVPWYLIACFWLPLSAVVWLPLYFAWEVFGPDTANQNSIRACLSSLCGAVLLMVGIVIWGFIKEDAFKTTGPKFFRTHPRALLINFVLLVPNSMFCYASQCRSN